MTQSGLWCSLGAHGSLVVIWWLCISGSGETRNFDFVSKIWPWRSKLITLRNYRDLNQCILHLWSKFGDPGLNGWWVMVRTSSKWGKFGLWPYSWPWRSRSITPQNNRDCNQVVLHLWSKFIISVKLIRQVVTQVKGQRTDGWTDGPTDRRMDRRTNDTRYTIIRPTFVGRIKITAGRAIFFT